MESRRFATGRIVSVIPTLFEGNIKVQACSDQDSPIRLCKSNGKASSTTPHQSLRACNRHRRVVLAGLGAAAGLSAECHILGAFRYVCLDHNHRFPRFQLRS